MTTDNKLTLTLNDVRESECGAGGRCNVGAGGFTSPPSSSRSGDPPRRGMAVKHHGRGTPKVSVIQRPQAVESPTQGHGSTLLLSWWNHLGDSRAERENDSRV